MALLPTQLLKLSTWESRLGSLKASLPLIAPVQSIHKSYLLYLPHTFCIWPLHSSSVPPPWCTPSLVLVRVAVNTLPHGLASTYNSCSPQSVVHTAWHAVTVCDATLLQTLLGLPGYSGENSEFFLFLWPLLWAELFPPEIPILKP